MQNANGGNAGILQNVANRRRDGEDHIPSPLPLSIQKTSIQPTAITCGHPIKLSQRLALFVTKPGGQAKAICATCWRLERANEFRQIVRVQFDSLFARLRPQLIPAGGASAGALLAGRAKGGCHV